MHEKEVVKIIISYLDTQFPIKCASCNRQYTSLSHYLKNTIMVGKPISYDVEEEDWQPRKQIGTACFANCKCGNTLTLNSIGMERTTLWRLLRWVKDESTKQGVDIRDLLVRICLKIGRQS